MVFFRKKSIEDLERQAREEEKKTMELQERQQLKDRITKAKSQRPEGIGKKVLRGVGNLGKSTFNAAADFTQDYNELNFGTPGRKNKSSKKKKKSRTQSRPDIFDTSGFFDF